MLTWLGFLLVFVEGKWQTIKYGTHTYGSVMGNGGNPQKHSQMRTMVLEDWPTMTGPPKYGPVIVGKSSSTMVSIWVGFQYKNPVHSRGKNARALERFQWLKLHRLGGISRDWIHSFHGFMFKSQAVGDSKSYCVHNLWQMISRYFLPTYFVKERRTWVSHTHTSSTIFFTNVSWPLRRKISLLRPRSWEEFSQFSCNIFV